VTTSLPVRSDTCGAIRSSSGRPAEMVHRSPVGSGDPSGLSGPGRPGVLLAFRRRRWVKF